MKSVYFLSLILLAGCSPLTTSPHDERYKLELTVHEVQTNLDDLRHDTNCFQTDLQILDGRIKCFENALAQIKQQDVEKQQARLEQISHSIQLMEKKWAAFEKKQEGWKEGVDTLSSHANDTTLALTQFKGRLEEIEKEIISQNRRLEALVKLKGNIEAIAKSMKSDGQKIYKVKPGDSLEKIAKAHRTDVSTLKQLNQLKQDLIVVDQELKVP